jgi:outer membrane immunogenic protein
MKRSFALTIAFLGLIGLTQIAYSGAERMDKNVVPAPAPCDWSGFYLGMNVGVAGLQTDITDLDDYNTFGTTSLEDTNFAVGGQMGYNWQKGAFVFGLEVDADYLNTEKSFNTFDNSGDPQYLYRAKVDFQGSLRARGGIAVDNALIYATGGVAVSHGSSKFNEVDGEDLPTGERATQDAWQPGFVGGVGVEYKFNCHWSARMEALYSHYPESTNVVEPGETNYRFSFQNDVYSARFGINYLFGGGH